MRLNNLTPAKGSKPGGKRFGRGHSAGQGKTCGRGQKGQHARAGGYRNVRIQGGQIPLQPPLPKVDIRSRSKASTAELRLHGLAIPEADVIVIAAVREARLISAQAERVKVIASGKLEKAVKVKGLALTKGARAAIEAAGGSIET
jgi:large subunit ribosomal protein L15